MNHIDFGRGYIYVASNSFIPNIFKVGMTKNHPEERIKSLNSNSTTLGEFSLIYSAKTLSSSDVEKKIHSCLFEHRVQNNREFFSCSLDLIISAINQYVIDDDLSYVQSVVDNVIHFDDLKMMRSNDPKLLNSCVVYRYVPLFYTVSPQKMEELLEAEKKLKELQQ